MEKKRLLNCVLGAILFALLVSCSAPKAEVDYDVALKSCVDKIIRTELSLEDKEAMPRCINAGETTWHTVNASNWCSGFWPGILWYAYEASGDPVLEDAADEYCASLKELAYLPADDHDLGFQLFCSYGNGYRLTKNPIYKQILLDAADTLATLYNPVVGSICSWPSKKQYPHNTIIDNMMNLELLYWAAKNGDKPELAAMATSHAEVTMKHIIRPDYSAYHLGSFSDVDGHFIEGKAHQGYADNSMWARGQAWGIYGFAFCFRETQRQDFLETAIGLSNKYIERVSEDGIPFWDFDDPKIPNTPKDASAAAVAACGFIELSKFVDEDLSVKYLDMAKLIVSTLSSPAYLSGEANQALLLHSVGHMPKKLEVDVPIIYADYYYMEALLRLKRLENKN